MEWGLLHLQITFSFYSLDSDAPVKAALPFSSLDVSHFSKLSKSCSLWNCSPPWSHLCVLAYVGSRECFAFFTYVLLASCCALEITKDTHIYYFTLLYEDKIVDSFEMRNLRSSSVLLGIVHIHRHQRIKLRLRLVFWLLLIVPSTTQNIMQLSLSQLDRDRASPLCNLCMASAMQDMGVSFKNHNKSLFQQEIAH